MRKIRGVKKSAEEIHLLNANIPGRDYARDKPQNCRLCGFWEPEIDDCERDCCWYLLPPPQKKPVEEFDEQGKLILNCELCPYGKLSPCIGYCIAKLHREVAEEFKKAREDP